MLDCRKIRVAVAGLVMCLGVGAMIPVAMAQQPGTVAEEVAANQSTPRGALKVLAAALQNGEGEKLRLVLTAETPIEQQMLQAMVEVATASGDVRKAAVAQFGEKGALPLTGDAAATLAKGNKSLDLATEKLDGSKATVVMPEAPDDQIHLVKDNNGQWHLPMKALARGVEPALIQERAEQMMRTVVVFKQITAEITQGKYAGADEVRTVIQQKLTAALTSGGPATAPATAPTTAPAR